jgi:Polyketide cyclase / dehydrase and lipid transport
METKITHTIAFDAPVELAYDFVTTWAHWPEWYPATLRVECEKGPALLGAKAVEHVKKLGLLGTLHWVVVARDRPRRFVMETTAIEMPLFSRAKLRITYEFRSAEGRTHLERTWTYELPTRALRLLDRVHLRRNFTAESDRALALLKGLVEAAARRARTEEARQSDQAHARAAP